MVPARNLRRGEWGVTSNGHRGRDYMLLILASELF
jgi:hypothetical protein